jgi:hypothetical protein
MCRNIKPLFNFAPSATDAEIHDAALQFVRKVSGFRQPSQVNEKAFAHAVEHISKQVRTLLSSLETDAPSKNREEEAAKKKARFNNRYPQ